MTLRAALILMLGMFTAAFAWRTVFLLVARKPVLGYVVGSTFSDSTRLSHRGWQRAMIWDAISTGEAEPPSESGTIRVRYSVDGRDYFTELPTVVRKGERPEPTLRLWYDPRDPNRVTDKGTSLLGLGSLFVLLGSLMAGVI